MPGIGRSPFGPIIWGSTKRKHNCLLTFCLAFPFPNSVPVLSEAQKEKKTCPAQCVLCNDPAIPFPIMWKRKCMWENITSNPKTFHLHHLSVALGIILCLIISVHWVPLFLFPWKKLSDFWLPNILCTISIVFSCRIYKIQPLKELVCKLPGTWILFINFLVIYLNIWMNKIV